MDIKTANTASWLSIVLGLSSLVLVGGCQTPGSKTALTGQVQRENAPAKELAPEKAAAACLATAKEMEAHGFAAEAADQYERARRFDPRLGPKVSARLAVLYDRLGNDDRALVEFQQALHSKPTDVALLNDFGFFHYERGQLEVAEKHFRQAVKNKPDYRRSWVNLGMVLAQEGRVEESLAAFTKVLRPEEAYTNLGILLAKQGKHEEGRQALQHALTIAPHFRQAQIFLDALDKQTGTSVTSAAGH